MYVVHRLLNLSRSLWWHHARGPDGSHGQKAAELEQDDKAGIPTPVLVSYMAQCTSFN